jgi:hypothetical protein
MNTERFSGIFDIALVLLGVLGATETPYFAKVWNDQTALRFAITPFLLIIITWLWKELFKSYFERKKKPELWLLFTEWAWELWCFTLAYYLLFFALSQAPKFTGFDTFYAIALGLIIYFGVELAYGLEYKDEVRSFYRNTKWLLLRILTGLGFVVVIYLIFIPI